jgi:hypothetical protein
MCTVSPVLDREYFPSIPARARQTPAGFLLPVAGIESQ